MGHDRLLYAVSGVALDGKEGLAYLHSFGVDLGVAPPALGHL